MGVRGLTTYISHRSNLYLKDFELHDSYLVVDGNSICSQLYNWHTKCNDCFGGDYDIYANVIYDFFELLSLCKVEPIVIFDGGYEKRKLKTVLDRMKNKLKSATAINSVNQGSIKLFPLFLRELFKDIVLKLNIKCVRCCFEADSEIAALAKALNCPVLSYDSDFYIFDSAYIPFSTFDLNPFYHYNKKTKENMYYIKCSIYHIDTFLDGFGGMDKANLPILAVLLGNDYNRPKQFDAFLSQLKLIKCKSQNTQQRRIKTLITWLKNETFESALKKILNRFKSLHRKRIIGKVRKAVESYSIVKSEIVDYLDLSIEFPEPYLDINAIFRENEQSDDETEEMFTTLEINNDEDNSEGDKTDLEGYDHSKKAESSDDNDSVDDEGAPISDSESVDYEVLNIQNKPLYSTLYFNHNYKKCIFPPCCMDMISLNKYYFIPLIEDKSEENAHKISLPILSCLYKILTSSQSEKLIYYDRGKYSRVRKYYLKSTDESLPSIEEIEHVTFEMLLEVYLKVLRLDKDIYNNIVQHFPREWHLILISLCYWIKNSKIDASYIYAVTLCAIILFYVDKNIGFYRSSRDFNKKYSKQLTPLLDKCKSKSEVKLSGNLEYLIKNIDNNESLICMHTMIAYFEMDPKLRTNVKLFDKGIVHLLSQFQSCLLHITYLNSLLKNPVEPIIVSQFYNGTFLYNMISDLQKRTNVQNYINLLLTNCPIILNILEYVANFIFKTNDNVVSNPKAKKRRKRRRKVDKSYETMDVENTNEINSDEDENLYDENNKFSVLQSVRT